MREQRCLGCHQPFLTDYALERVCVTCRTSALETLAARLDKSYDPRQAQEWERCAAVLNRLWCYPLFWEMK